MAPKMANFTLDDLEERINKLEELQEIQESNDNSINQVKLTLQNPLEIILELNYLVINVYGII